MSSSNHIKLSELTRQIGQVIKQQFANQFYWVVAEVSSHKFYPNQDRHYFELVEKSESGTEPLAKLRAVAWKEGTERIKYFESETGQVFQNGLQVLLQVKVEYHAAFGLTLVIANIDAYFTLGMLEQQRRDTLKRLVDQNPDAIKLIGDEYVTRNKNLKLSTVVQSIAVLASPNSEGYKDFMHTLQENPFNYRFAIDVYQTSVQGTEAGPEIVRKLVAIFESKIIYQAVVIIRGGGSKTDFLVFDSYQVARAVARFPLPVITGIGHLGDVCVTDLMTHASTKTPTKAAEFIVAHNRFFEDRILGFQKAIAVRSQQMLASQQALISSSRLKLVNMTRQKIVSQKDEVSNFRNTLVSSASRVLYNSKARLLNASRTLTTRPSILIACEESQLINFKQNLALNTRKLLMNQKGEMSHFVSVIRLMDPVNLLKKGFALVYKNGKIVTDSNSLNLGEHFEVKMQDGMLLSELLSKKRIDG